MPRTMAEPPRMVLNDLALVYSPAVSGLIARVWRARIDERRGDEYDEFARTRSLPTFRAHEGFRGCAFLGTGSDRVVLTLWASLEAIAALERSARYRRTVADIEATGFVLETTEAITAPVDGHGETG
jgi:heme-degrading monooxygenase HmoA